MPGNTEATDLDRIVSIRKKWTLSRERLIKFRIFNEIEEKLILMFYNILELVWKQIFLIFYPQKVLGFFSLKICVYTEC